MERVFGWWRGPTLGTWLDVRRGHEVGRDAFGNRYFELPGGRRWVLYAGENDSSQVPPEWHLWLHHTRRDPPSAAPLPVRPWERPWRPNPTGTPAREVPSGALSAGGRRARSTADYRPWTPGG
ncbi:MAG: NADH-ubiquinone oxidoreductase subunit NDUFA12 family protein [Thermaurantiacus sp.]|uniref:NADH-ubiquinone oxidoreductase subunit NDUFA12 family protein n=1 Tax=Thermaurantiacus sp. TaxID=2820283 RepID=UPI00298F349A|nr:NADH-ubiquinone oxidoreductase subunit NDUFA12 family protein [Thermaurantiacus sp.]MDW8414618.1 NADH-ubiquinone oxidoreductase subunit NDUFA12 family protein [Thermaurantiacus sp.]